MKICDILSGSAKPFPSLEIVPPLNGMTVDELVSRVEPLMEFGPKYVNVTRHRDDLRMSQKTVCGALMDRFGINVVPHILCAGATGDDIRGELDAFKEMGIENVLALRGDCLSGEKRFVPVPGGYAHASDLVRGIREYRSSEGTVYSIGVAGYPEKHFEAPNLRTDIENLRKKVDAGADYVITQLFFDNALYYSFVDKCRQAGIDVPYYSGYQALLVGKSAQPAPSDILDRHTVRSFVRGDPCR